MAFAGWLLAVAAMTAGARAAITDQRVVAPVSMDLGGPWALRSASLGIQE